MSISCLSPFSSETWVSAIYLRNSLSSDTLPASMQPLKMEQFIPFVFSNEFCACIFPYFTAYGYINRKWLRSPRYPSSDKIHSGARMIPERPAVRHMTYIGVEVIPSPTPYQPPTPHPNHHYHYHLYPHPPAECSLDKQPVLVLCFEFERNRTVLRDSTLCAINPHITDQ